MRKQILLLCLAIIVLLPLALTSCGNDGGTTTIINTTTTTVITTLPTTSSTTPVSTTAALSEQPDLVTFSKYFSDMGLGKLPDGGQLPFDLVENVTIFSKGDQVCLYGTVIQEVQITADYYNVASGETIGAGSPPGKMALGGFAGSSELDLAAGKYEYKVYVNGTLVAVLPFEVK